MEDNKTNSDNETKYQELLGELSNSRNKLTEMLNEIEDCKNAVLDTAKSNDYRNRYAKEERIKTISAFYSLLLQTRQEYTRNIISEIDLRRKLEKGDDKEVELDISKIAKQLESVRKKQKSIEDSKLLKPAQILMENSK